MYIILVMNEVSAVRIESKCPFFPKSKYLIRIKTLNIVLMIYI